jgi:hypothetical protein
MCQNGFAISEAAERSPEKAYQNLSDLSGAAPANAITTVGE